MATAYVKNIGLKFFSDASLASEITEIHRNREVEPHYLRDFSEGALLGTLTKNYRGDFVQVDYKFDIRIKGWTGVAYWAHHVETLWVLEEDITTDSPTLQQQQTAALKAADRKALVDKLVNDPDPSLAASGSDTKSNSGLLVGGIVAGVGLLIGVLIWAFGKNKNAPKPVAPPTIIQLSKPPKK